MKREWIRLIIEVLVGLIIACYGLLLGDIYAKVNDGVFVRRQAYQEQTQRRDRELDRLQESICERLRRLEANTDEILRYLRDKQPANSAD